MFVCGGSFYEVCAYIMGYAHASPECPLGEIGWKGFQDFVCAKFRFPQKYYWPAVLKNVSCDDDDAVKRLKSLLTEFAERTRSESPEDIGRQAMVAAWNQPEGEPEKTWRIFSRVLHTGNKEKIEPLIEEHPDAAVLWSSPHCPNDSVAPLLDQIQESYMVSRLSGSEEDGEVTIFTAGFGAISLTRIAGRWKVDATPIIECRKGQS